MNAGNEKFVPDLYHQYIANNEQETLTKAQAHKLQKKAAGLTNRTSTGSGNGSSARMLS